MKAEISLKNIGGIGISTSMKDGILLGKITCNVAVNPGDVARLLNFQKQHAQLNLVIESPQAVMDLAIETIHDPDDEAVPVTPFEYIEMRNIEPEAEDEPRRRSRKKETAEA